MFGISIMIRLQNQAKSYTMTDFPFDLPLRCIKLSNIGDNEIVLDPFCGSGTTCLAARSLNKQYLGFELNPKNVEIAWLRLQGTNTKS